MSLKQDIYDHCLRVLDEQAMLTGRRIEELREAISNETKSTAGDKYETARAMIHLEQEQVARQLQEVLRQQDELRQIVPGQSYNRITKGSLVRTDKGYFFIAVGLGKQLVAGTLVYVISPGSPLGVLMRTAAVGQELRLNNIVYRIEAIS